MKRITDVMTDWDDIDTLGIWLHCDRAHVRRMRSEHYSVKGAALIILESFYNRNTEPEAEKWGMMIEALRELGKEATIERLGLKQMQTNLGN